MPHWLKVLLVVILFLLAGVIPLAMHLASGTIEGVVSDEFGPVAHAEVEAQHSTSAEVARTTSDANGHFRLDGLRRGWYSLWVKAPSGNSVRIPRVFVEDGAVSQKDVRLYSPPSSIESAAP